jgi:hypothetical protein
MKISEAKAIAGSLGYPSKMPGTSYGIPARACHMGAKLVKVPGSVCHGCYALKGNYRFTGMQAGLAKRLAGLTDPRWVDAMVSMLLVAHGRRNKKVKSRGWHRWHDSGDLQSVDHLEKICQVATATPRIRHWLATRELAMVKAYLAKGGMVPDNLTIRVSATMVDGPATTQWPTTSTVHKDKPAAGRVCPAPLQGNECGKCRVCWSKTANISYHKH